MYFAEIRGRTLQEQRIPSGSSANWRLRAAFQPSLKSGKNTPVMTVLHLHYLNFRIVWVYKTV